MLLDCLPSWPDHLPIVCIAAVLPFRIASEVQFISLPVDQDEPPLGQDAIEANTGGRVGQLLDGGDGTFGFASTVDLEGSSIFACALVLGNAGAAKSQERSALDGRGGLMTEG